MERTDKKWIKLKKKKVKYLFAWFFLWETNFLTPKYCVENIITPSLLA